MREVEEGKRTRSVDVVGARKKRPTWSKYVDDWY